MAVAGTAPAFPHEEMRVVWRSLPSLLGTLLWVPQLADFMALPLLFTLYTLLPRSALRRWWHWALIWLPAVTLSGWGVAALHRRVYHPEFTHRAPPMGSFWTTS